MATTEPVPPQHHRPTLWIALTVVFAIVAIVLAIVALNKNSQLNTAQDDLASTKSALAAEQQKAQKASTTGDAVTSALAAGVSAVQSQLGITPIDPSAAQQQLQDAQAKVDAASQQVDTAKGKAAQALAQAQVVAAKGTIAVTCARAAAGVLGTLGSGSGGIAARAQTALGALKALGPQCKTAFAGA